MNYLAHILLADNSPEARLGALLGDFVRAGGETHLGPVIQAEILMHRRIDSYTDSHTQVRQAKALFAPERRRFAGIVLDIYYDHLLVQNWSRYCTVAVDEFIASFYRGLEQQRHLFPPRFAAIAPYMVEEDWLGSYASEAGVEWAIRRVSGRLSRNGHLLRAGLLDLATHQAAIAAGFDEFFPQLVDYVRARRTSNELLPDCTADAVRSGGGRI